MLVATVKALKMHGGLAKSELASVSYEALNDGLSNLGRHIENLQQYGLPVVVAINRFTSDTEGEIDAVEAYCAKVGVPVALCTHWAEGGRGAEALARIVTETLETKPADFRTLYPDDMPLFDKIETVARRIYRADHVEAPRAVRDQLARWEADGFGHLPVCIAKTQYSFSTDPSRVGAPEGHTVRLREVRLSAGAGFIVAICGDIMTMPGLPRHPAAESIHLNDQGLIEGLF